jgi:hypothetical protein
MRTKHVGDIFVGGDMIKGANGTTLQKDNEYFLVFFIFLDEFFFNEIFCNLSQKIHIVAPIYHRFYVK